MASEALSGNSSAEASASSRTHALGVGGIGGLAVAAGFVVAVLFLAVFALLLGFARAILAHVQAVEQVMHHVAEAPLIVEHALEAIEIAAGALLDQRAPQLDKLARGRRRRLAGKPFADDHGDGILERRIGPVGDLVVFAAMKTVIEHGGKVLRHAAHAARADCLDAGLLDRLKHRARLLAAGHEFAMHGRVMTGKPQRDRVGVTAHDGRLSLIEPARRLRQPRFAAGQPGALGREGDLDVTLAGDRA